MISPQILKPNLVIPLHNKTDSQTTATHFTLNSQYITLGHTFRPPSSAKSGVSRPMTKGKQASTLRL